MRISLLILLLLPLSVFAEATRDLWSEPQEFPTTLAECIKRFPDKKDTPSCRSIMDGTEEVAIENDLGSYQMNPCQSQYQLRDGKKMRTVSQKEFCQKLTARRKKEPVRYRFKGCC